MGFVRCRHRGGRDRDGDEAVTDIQWFIAIGGAAAGTYILRAAPFLWTPLRDLGARYVDFLTYVSFAIAAGIVSKALLLDGGRLVMGMDTYIKFVGLAVALGSYRWIRNIPLALFVGAGSAVLIRWLFS